MIRATSLELDYPGDGLMYLNDEPFTGFHTFCDDSGWECAEHEYRDGLLYGIKRMWWRPGLLELEAECKWGVYHGRVREWHESGHLAFDAMYEHGVKLRGKMWNELGEVIEDYTLSESEPSFRLLESFRQKLAQAASG